MISKWWWFRWIDPLSLTLSSVFVYRTPLVAGAPMIRVAGGSLLASFTTNVVLGSLSLTT